MPFSRAIREQVLALSWRSCCICQTFAGRYLNVHHIVQEADGGPNDIENAIALCDRCHGEAGHYNPRHPLGTKYSPAELRAHRDRWWDFVEQEPGIALPKDPVAISPTKMNFPRRKGETHRFDLHLNNQSNRVLYGLSIAIFLAGSAESPLDVRPAGPLEPPFAPKVDFEVIRFDSGCFILETKDDKGMRVIWLCIWGLSPHTLHTLPLALSVAEDIPSGADAFARVMLTNFQHEQPPIIRRPSEITPGWNEALVRIWLGETPYWTGVMAGPVEEPGTEPG